MIRFLIVTHLVQMASAFTGIRFRYPSPMDQMEAVALTHNITDRLQQEISTSQYLYCPLVPLCDNLTRSQPYTNTQYGSCCYDCACDTSGVLKGEQCPGIETKARGYDQFESCIRPQFLPYGMTPVNFIRSYYMIIQCAQNFKDNTIRRKCISDQSAIYPPELSLYVPVFSNVTGKLFKNVYCGMCNFEERNDLLDWEIELICRDEVPFVKPPSSESELLQMVSQERQCNIRFYSLRTTTTDVACDWGFYTTCNQTGKWKHYDSLIEQGCLSYTSVYIGKYRNVFCFMCNEDETPYMGCTQDDFLTNSGGNIGSFTGLIRYRQEPVIDEPMKCTEQEIYDEYKDVCQPVICPPYYYYNTTHCAPLFEDMSYRKYEVYIKVRIESETELCKTDACTQRLLETVASELSRHILQQFGVTHPFTFRFVFSRDLEYCAENTDAFVSTIEISTKRFDFWFKMLFAKSFRHDQQEVLEKFMASLKETNMNYNNKDIIIFPELTSKMAHENENSLLPVAINRATNDYVCQTEMDTVKVTRDYFCPRIGLEMNDVTISDSNVIITSLNITYNINSVYNDSDRVMVCLFPYMEAVSLIQNQSSRNISNPFPEDDVIEEMLSLVCSTLSIISLICVIIVFSLFRELRTIPGINNMILSAHLIIANLLYLFGINAVSNFNLCVAVGMLTHFFWIASIMWMHVCSIHMFRVFFFMRKLPKDSQSKRVIIMYGTYAVFASVLVVSVNLIYSSFNQTITSSYLGYGGNKCYITNPDMVLYTFAVPVGGILTSNIVLFCMAIYRIEKLPEVNSADGHSRNMFAIYLKLTCLTGVTWIFGFIYQWTLVKALSYIFIVLNASQGFFIFLSFCFNSRVKNMCASRMKRSHDNSSSSKKSHSSSFLTSTRTFLTRLTSRSVK